MWYDYLKPFYGLTQGWELKALLSAIGVFLWDMMGRIFMTSPDLIALLGLLIIVDTITGRSASRRRGEEITSKRMQEAVAKVIAYGIAGSFATAVSNIYGPRVTIPGLEVAIAQFGVGMYFYLSLIELQSIMENLFGDHAPDRLRVAWQLVRGKTTVEDLFTDNDEDDDNERAGLGGSTPTDTKNKSLS